MLLLFVKGERGLVANHEGKFYFPDRRSTITEEGLYKCTVTVEKPNYGFVVGELEPTYMPSSTIYINYVNSCKLRSQNFYIKHIGGSIILFITGYNTLFIKYIRKDHQIATLEMSTNRSLYDPAHFPNVSKDMLGTIFRSTPVSITQANYKDIITHYLGYNYTRVIFGKYTCINIVVYDSKYIVLNFRNLLTSLHNEWNSIITVYTRNGFIDVTTLYNVDKDFTNKTLDIKLSDIVKYMRDNHIGIRPYMDPDTPIYDIDIKVLGNVSTIKVINAMYSDPISDEDKEQVDKSWEDFRAIKKIFVKR